MSVSINYLESIFRGSLGGLIDNKTPMVCSGIPSYNQVLSTIFFIWRTLILKISNLWGWSAFFAVYPSNFKIYQGFWNKYQFKKQLTKKNSTASKHFR